MGRYLVSTRSEQPVEVDAPNWLVALGVGLDMLGAVTSIDRLACEVLANGKVIARDARSGLGVVVQAVDADEEEAPIPEPVDLATADGPIVEIYDDDSYEDSSHAAPSLPVLAYGADDADDGEDVGEEDDTFALPASEEGYEEEEEVEDETFSVSEEEQAWQDESAFFGVGVDCDSPQPVLREVFSDPVHAPSTVGMGADAGAPLLAMLEAPEDTDGGSFVLDPDEPDLGTDDALEALEAFEETGELTVEADGDADEAVLALEGALLGGIPPLPPAPGMPQPDAEPVPDEALERVLEQVRGCVTADSAWRVALEGAQTLIPAESGAALRQEWDGTMRFIAALGPQAHKILGERVPAGLGIVGFCARRRVGLSIQEPAHDPRFFANIDRRTGYRTTSILAMPVVFEDTLFGCLELLNAPQRFTDDDMERLDMVAITLAEQLLVAV